jgi:hypothetical protein
LLSFKKRNSKLKWILAKHQKRKLLYFVNWCSYWISWKKCHHSEISKTNTKTLIYTLWIRPQGFLGCQKMCLGPLNTPFEVWSANIAPKLKNIRNTLRKQGFFDIIFSILTIFRSLCLFGTILAQKLNCFVCEKKI